MEKYACVTSGISLSLILLASDLSAAQSSPPSGQEIRQRKMRCLNSMISISYSATGKFTIEN